MRNADQRSARRIGLLSCCATIALTATCGLTAPAFAQDTAAAAPAEDTSVVVVTGIRRGIQNAITAKRRSSQIVEAVSAEDIGKLPDASIAESIARLPGIAAQRTNGRAQSLSVRGLGPDYTVTTLNGREQVSTGDNRSVEFDQYPSELISQVVIYKTPNASMTTQGIAGTADLQTVRPLAFGKRAAAINIRGEVNSEDAVIPGMKNTGNRFSAMYIDQFANKTIGLALGYAHTDSPYQVQRQEPWGDGGFPRCGDNGSTNTVCNGANANLFVIGGMKDGVNSSNLTRDGYMGVLEWRPNDALRVTVDAYHSDFEELQKTARLEFPLAWSGAQLQPGFTTGDTFVTHGVFTNVTTVVENYTNQRKATLDAAGLNVEYDLNDEWSLTGDVALSKAVRDDLILESTAGTGFAGSGARDTVTFTSPNEYGRTTLTNVLDYSDFSTTFLTDPGGWGGPVNRAGFVRTPHIEDELTIIKLAASRKVDNVFSKVTFGVSSTNREKSRDGMAGYLTLKTGAQAVVPQQYRLGTTDTSFFGTTKGMIAYDSLAMWNDDFFGVTPDTSAATTQDTWNIDETIDVAYVRADIDTTVWGVPLTGNIGVQNQHAEQTATSYYTDGTPAGLSLQTRTVAYSDLLPSLNLNFALSDTMTLRFGAGTTIARPRMDDMGRGVSFTPVCDTCQPVIYNGGSYYWSGNGGNPAIQPWKADAIDLSFEKYFGGKGYVSVAAFHKELTSYIYSQTILRDYTGAVLPTGAFTQANTHRTGTISVNQNGSGGWIKGIELSVSTPGELLSPVLDGFGVIVSAAFNDSEINPSGTNPIDLPGLSKTVVNTTLYYEKHGFSARISNRYRGEFLGEVPNFTNNLQNRYVAAESLLDAQLGYTFEAGSLKGLSLSFSATNITNEPFKLYAQGNPANVMREEVYGTTYLFGLNYRFF